MVNSFAAVTVNHIQTWATGTNGAVISDSVLAAGQIGAGSWGFSGESASPFRSIKIATNYPVQLPYWVNIGGTNYSTVWTNWVTTFSNTLGTYDRAQLTLAGPAGGNNSNLWFGYFWRTTMNNAGSDCNYDITTVDGQFSGYFVQQQKVRNGFSLLYAHTQGGTQGLAVPILPDGRLYWVQGSVDLRGGVVQLDYYDATNNWKRATNEAGTFGSTGTITPGTNTFRFWLQANYLNLGQVTGSNMFSALFFGYGNNSVTSPPMSTNIIVSDRIQSYVHGTNFAVRGIRPVRTNETLVGDISDSDNGPEINAAIAAVGEGGVVLISGTNKITTSINSANKTNFTFRGTNNAMVLMLGSSTVSFGPTPLSAGQADVFYPTNGGISRGATNVTLITNYSTINGERMSPGASFRISQLNGNDTNYLRAMTTSGSERSASQLVMILTTNGNTITWTPEAHIDYTNTPAFVEAFAAMKGGVGIENITFSLSNAVGYSTNGAIQNVNIQGLYDSWMTGCKSEYYNNYGVKLGGVLFCDFNSNTIHSSLTGGTSHGGLLTSGIQASYVYNNIIYNASPAIQSFYSDQGNVFFGNYITNTDVRGILIHASGANWNIWEQNVIEGTNGGSAIYGDAYFGFNWMTTFFRNRFEGFSWKRFQSFMTALGNSLGSTNFSIRYDMYANGNVYEAYEIGNPNIGNLQTNGISPPTSWNFPGTIAGIYSNVFYKFTNVSLQVVNGTNILGVFSNWPPSAAGYNIIFQDGTDTNRYWTLAQWQTNVASQENTALSFMGPTESNIFLVPGTAPMMPISNGWTMLIAGPTMYQQRQTIDVSSHLRSFTHVITNSTEAVVHDPTYLPRNFPASIVFGSAPSWWGTNRWPAIDPADANEVTPIPAKSRFMVEAPSEPEPPTPPGQAKSRGPGFRGAGAKLRRF